MECFHFKTGKLFFDSNMVDVMFGKFAEVTLTAVRITVPLYSLQKSVFFHCYKIFQGMSTVCFFTLFEAHLACLQVTAGLARL